VTEVTQPVTTTNLDAERARIAALSYDKAFAEFRAVVEKLETGNLPLEESIALFEQGVLLQRRCERMLSEAELRFQRLVEGSGGKVRALDLSLGEADETA
jgi:exodeoxyribonuclease VII small subunit